MLSGMLSQLLGLIMWVSSKDLYSDLDVLVFDDA
jgi:hypothetical protein